MNLTDLFEVAHGTVIGREHREMGLNNQDAYHWQFSNDTLIAVVCDGVSKSIVGNTEQFTHNEFGAQLLVRATVKLIHKWANDSYKFSVYIDAIQYELEKILMIIGNLIADNNPEFISQFFSTTIVGLIITSDDCYLFHLGDGYFIHNGNVIPLGNNSNPPLISHNLMGGAYNTSFKWRYYPTELTDSVAICSDGMRFVPEFSDRMRLPLRPVVVQFLEDSRYYTNPCALTRDLAILNRDISTLDESRGTIKKSRGVLLDDTTLFIARRKGDQL